MQAVPPIALLHLPRFDCILKIIDTYEGFNSNYYSMVDVIKNP